jgi:DNA-binding CsgD family transcriptional regulator
VDELVLAYESGLTVYELAKRFKCHRTTVSGHLRARRVVMRLKPMTEEDVDRAVELYESGLSFVKVGDRLGRDGETIRQRLIERGVERRGRKNRGK